MSMKKSLFFVWFIFVSILLTWCSQQKDIPEQSVTPISQNESTIQQDYSNLQSKISAEKIEIIEFHNTNRCASCLRMEELLKKTLSQNFPNEIKDGKVVFSDINIDLPENNEIATKYQAWWLSVFINAITSGQDNIEQETDAWRLIWDEIQFIDYMTKRINALLGK